MRRYPLLLATLSAALLLLVLPPPAQAQGKRVALCVGNDAYPTSPLNNAGNDAKAVARELTAAGYTVDLQLNVNGEALERAVIQFVGKLRDADVGLFFYAGHGIQIENSNYLIPVDFTAMDEIQAKRRGFDVEELRQRMDGAGARAKVIILDACRDNPFKFTRSGSRGLASMQPGQGTLIAFATGPGQTASDNKAAGNGLFTQHFLQALKEPGLEIREVFQRTREAVSSASGQKQRPWVNDDITGQVYLRPPAAGATPGGGGQVAAAALELEFWKGVQAIGTADAYRRYKAKYPNGQFADIAEMQLEKLSPTKKVRGSLSGGAVVSSGSGPAKPPATTPPAARPPAPPATQPAPQAAQAQAASADPRADFAAKVPQARAACQQGNAEACFVLGYAHWAGEGASRDDKEANRLLAGACEAKIAPACALLGSMYEDGRGVREDLTQAAQLYIRSCGLGSHEGCAAASNSYYNGRGMPQDYTQAARFAYQACQGGDTNGCMSLGVMYYEGQGVGRNDQEAFRLLTWSCNNGNLLGCANLGEMYENGRGVRKDTGYALKLYKHACDNGQQYGCQNLQRLGGK